MGLSENIAKKLSQEINNKLLADVYVSCGWTKVENQFYYNAKHAVDINCWMSDNCKGKIERIGRHWLFEDANDATMFILRWA